MAIPVIDFSKLNGEERANTLAEIANGNDEWFFLLQLVSHGISEELLEKVKRICSECFKKEREAKFKESTAMRLLSEAEKNNEAA